MATDSVLPVGSLNKTEILATTDSKVLMSIQVFSYFMLINVWGPGQCITIVGLIVNVLNLIMFAQQGLQDSVNTTLLGLTISDLGSLVFVFQYNMFWTPSFMRLDLPFYPEQLMYFMFYGHVLFTRVTTGTTAWIAIERCLCIVAPLKVKTIMTKRKTIIFICTLYVITFASLAPLFYTSRCVWLFDSARNKSRLGLVKMANRGHIDGVVYVINNFLPVGFFVIIVVCTIILTRALQKNAQWRQSSTAKDVASTRDMKVVKLVLIISIIFIFCYAPGAVFFMWVFLDPDMKIDGKQKHFLVAFFSLLLLLENINATANFFVYIKMSSKFRSTFKQLLHLHKRKTTESKHFQTRSRVAGTSNI